MTAKERLDARERWRHATSAVSALYLAADARTWTAANQWLDTAALRMEEAGCPDMAAEIRTLSDDFGGWSAAELQTAISTAAELCGELERETFGDVAP